MFSCKKKKKQIKHQIILCEENFHLHDRNELQRGNCREQHSNSWQSLPLTLFQSTIALQQNTTRKNERKGKKHFVARSRPYH